MATYFLGQFEWIKLSCPRPSPGAEKESIGFNSDKSIILKILSVSVYKGTWWLSG